MTNVDKLEWLRVRMRWTLLSPSRLLAHLVSVITFQPHSRAFQLQELLKIRVKLCTQS
jgi:hypothetical protein